MESWIIPHFCRRYLIVDTVPRLYKDHFRVWKVDPYKDRSLIFGKKVVLIRTGDCSTKRGLFGVLCTIQFC